MKQAREKVILSLSSEQGKGKEGGWGLGPRQLLVWGASRASLWEEPASCSQGQAQGRHTPRLTGDEPSPQWSLGFGESLWSQLRLNKSIHNTSSPTTCLTKEHKLSL